MSDHHNDAYPAPGISVRDKGPGRPVDLFVGGTRRGSYKSADGLLKAIERYRAEGKEIADRVAKQASVREHHEELRRFGDRMEALKKDSHILQQVERLMPALTLINGTKDVKSVQEYIEFVAVSVARLELKPRLEFSGNYGGICVARGPMQGYAIFIWATDVYAMHLDHGTFEGLDHWNEGLQARFEEASTT